MNPSEFRRLGHLLVDWIADYHTRVGTLPVMSKASPGDIRAALPPGEVSAVRAPVGRPRRGGNGTDAPRLACTSAGSEAIIGVSNKPGAMVMIRMPKRAISRAIGSVMPTTPAFDAA